MRILVKNLRMPILIVDALYNFSYKWLKLLQTVLEYMKKFSLIMNVNKIIKEGNSH